MRRASVRIFRSRFNFNEFNVINQRDNLFVSDFTVTTGPVFVIPRTALEKHQIMVTYTQCIIIYNVNIIYDKITIMCLLDA